MAWMINNLPAVQETWVWSLGREDPLEEEMATHCSVLAWRIPRTKQPGKLWSMGLQRVRQDWTTNLSLLPWNPSMCMRSPIFVKPWTPTLTPKLNWCVDRGQFLSLWCMAGVSATTWKGKGPQDVRFCSLCFSPEILSEVVAIQVLSALLHQAGHLTFHQHHSVTWSCCCSFIVSRETRKSLPTLLFFSKIVLYILLSLIFHIHFRISFIMGTHIYGGWLASPLQWAGTRANSGRWGGTGKPSMLQSTGSWRVGHDLATEQQHVCMYYCVL